MPNSYCKLNTFQLGSDLLSKSSLVRAFYNLIDSNSIISFGQPKSLLPTLFPSDPMSIFFSSENPADHFFRIFPEPSYFSLSAQPPLFLAWISLIVLFTFKLAPLVYFNITPRGISINHKSDDTTPLLYTLQWFPAHSEQIACKVLQD